MKTTEFMKCQLPGKQITWNSFKAHVLLYCPSNTPAKLAHLDFIKKILLRYFLFSHQTQRPLCEILKFLRFLKSHSNLSLMRADDSLLKRSPRPPRQNRHSRFQNESTRVIQISMQTGILGKKSVRVRHKYEIKKI